MWFKNLQLYRFTAPFTLTADDLEQHLNEHPFKPCGKLDPSQYGWVAPMGPDFTPLVHAGNGCLMICARKEEKVLPATVVREKVGERARAIEIEEGRRVYRKERDNLKEEIIQDCLPRAFTRSSRTYAYIAPAAGWLLVDAASPKKAEELTSFLRQSITSLPVVPPQVADTPALMMSDWLRGNAVPADLQLGDECELREPGDEGGIIRCKRQDLTSEEILLHLEAGKQVVKIAVEWDEQLSCMLAEDLSIKRLKFADKLVSEGADAGDGDAAAQFDADFALMSAALNAFLPRLLSFFGGPKAAAV
ncbi:recombination-associated protein RdgC [Exilibacterium tricleocarpae]|uniref:Recombination-associated protein RdgC n=1 Tax=Exilibacterium tricleocarpae TaxID=2591008 RepID=A0A545TNX3_9GAMM|nr:recombination-associated protein RdgC [Exilibacterium tricleocarpae]TQV78871.1 recombination-associated protein RdgC [Exilibacterium tricleocarpae]